VVAFLGATTDAAAAAALPAAGAVPEASTADRAGAAGAAGAAGVAHGMGWWAAAGGDSVAAVALVARWSRVEEELRRAEGAARCRAAPLPAGLMVRDVYALSPWGLRRKAQVRAPLPFTIYPPLAAP
jgi:hypothetical protein